MVGAMAATAIFTLRGSALFLLAHGKDTTIPKGTNVTAFIQGNVFESVAITKVIRNLEVRFAIPVISRAGRAQKVAPPTVDSAQQTLVGHSKPTRGMADILVTLVTSIGSD